MFHKKPFLLLKYEFLLRVRITKFLSVKNDVMFLLYTKVFPLHTTYIYNTGVEKIIMCCFSWSFRFPLNESWRKIFQVLKGDTGKQALKHICQRFFNFQPIFLKLSANASFFWGSLNRAIRSDLTLLHSAHFALHSAHFAPKKNQLSTLKNKKVGKPVQNARCAVQNVHCAVVLGQIWLHG